MSQEQLDRRLLVWGSVIFLLIGSLAIMWLLNSGSPERSTGRANIETKLGEVKLPIFDLNNPDTFLTD